MMALRDKETRELVKTFLNICITSQPQTADDFAKINNGYGMRGMDGATFLIGPDLAGAERSVVRSVEKAIGPHKAHQKEIGDILYSRGRTIVVEQRGVSEDDVTSCIGEFETLANAITRFLHPAFNWQLGQHVREVSVGPVKLRSGDLVVAELQPQSKIARYNVGSPIGLRTDSTGVQFGLAPTMWDISVIASKKALRQEAEWLADVFGSFVRSIIPWTMLGDFVPRLGELEVDPFRAADRSDAAITINSTGGALIGGSKLPNGHIVSKEAAALLEGEICKLKADAIFGAAKGTLGARVYLGLGWLTRARRSDDRAEKVMYSFTALEALLSRSDSNSPVVQTVARNTASLWSDDNAVRLQVADSIISLYTGRSKLIHAGNRDIFYNQVNELQNITESVFERVIDVCDLNEKHDDFANRLKAASFGLPLFATDGQ